MEAKYDNHGWEVEERSVGPDLKPMPLKDGCVIAKMQYDRYGRLERMTFHGLKGEPVVSKNGYHGFEAKYDEHGNETVETYLGKDGKPMSVLVGQVTVNSNPRQMILGTIGAVFAGIAGGVVAGVVAPRFPFGHSAAVLLFLALDTASVLAKGSGTRLVRSRRKRHSRH